MSLEPPIFWSVPIVVDTISYYTYIVNMYNMNILFSFMQEVCGFKFAATPRPTPQNYKLRWPHTEPAELLFLLNYIEPSRIGVCFYFLYLPAPLIVAKLLILDTDLRIRCNGLRQKYIAADNRTAANDCIAAEDRCSRVDRNIVFNSRMTLFVSERLSASC